MTNPLSYYIKIYTNYDGSQLLIITGIILALMLTYSYWKTKSKELVLALLAGFIVSQVMFTLMVYIISLIGVGILPLVHLPFTAVKLLSLVNLGGLVDFYIEELAQKNFDPDHVTRMHFKLSLKHGVLALLLSVAAVPLIETPSLWLIIILGLGAVITVATNHLFARLLIVEK